jgi:undecaprenyl-diphosphatase
MITFFQAIIIGLLQGFTELFPISSLGHSILIADLFGWSSIISAQTEKGSFYLTFLVAVHVATATALFIFYRKTWYKIVIGFIESIRTRSIKTVHQKLAWLLIIATIPAGIIGLVFESFLRSLFAIPIAAAFFLIINGIILLVGDALVKRSKSTSVALNMQDTNRQTALALTFPKAGIIGAVQTFALIAGISRSGITMVSGLFVGLSYEAAARFSFLLATPIIFLAGIYKLPDLLKVSSRSFLPQTIVGALVAGIAAYIAVRFLDKYFQTKRLWPFALYCFIFGGFMVLFTLFAHN